MCILFVFGVVLVLSKILLSCCPVAVYGYSEKLPSSFKLFAVVCYALILSYKVENVPALITAKALPACAVFNAKSPCFMPVSYTHLDVYKRQPAPLLL